MELLHKLVTLFDALSPFHIRSDPRPDSFKNSLFKKLPIELIVSIAEFLPLEAAALFTLTCRPVWYILGNQYLDRLSAIGHKLNRLLFLEFLERDLAYQIVCYNCQRLHSGTKQRYNSLWGSFNQPPCSVRDLNSHVQYNIQDGFCSITFQSAMKLYRHGLDYSEQISLLTGFGSPNVRGYTYQWTSIPRIVNGHFILRHQVWLLYPVGYEVIMPDTIYTDICPHWQFNCLGWSKLNMKLACRISHWDNLRLNLRCPTCSGLFQCRICPTEFQINTKDFLRNGVALVLTRWLDLGEGRDLSDPRYASHVYHGYGSCYRDTPVPFEAGSIRAAYEGESFDEEKLLTPEYKFELFWSTRPQVR
mgnify:CR=1 FL=1